MWIKQAFLCGYSAAKKYLRQPLKNKEKLAELRWKKTTT
jgi:hypothetical protein